MNQFRSPILRLVFSLIKWMMRPFPGLRIMLVKGLILMEEQEVGQDFRENLVRLLEVHGFTEFAIDRLCVKQGNGVHVKHQIMDGIHSFFTDRVSPDARVLDVGCGIGALAHAIAVNSQADVIGMDTNEAHIRFASERFRHPRLDFIVGDVTVDLPEEQIDVIILSSLLEHLDDRVGFLGQLRAKYQPKKFLVRVPTFERHFFAALKQHLGLFAYTDPDHSVEYTLESFAGEMRSAGLEIRHLEVRWGDIWAEVVPCGSVWSGS